MRKTLMVFALLAVVMPCVQAADWKMTLKDALSGNTYPLSLTPKDLDGDWRRISASEESTQMGGYVQAVAAAFGRMARTTDEFYTKGDTVTLGGEVYVIAYRPKKKPFDPSIFERPVRPPKPEKLTPDTELTLSLLNLRSAGSLTDIRPFNLEEEIALYQEEERRESLDNLKQLGSALSGYMAGRDDKLPPIRNPQQVQKLLVAYTRNKDVFVNPKTKEPYAVNTILSGRKLAHISNPSEMVVFYEATPAEDGTRGVVFLDGHAARVPESEWDLVKRRSRLR